MYDRAGCGGSSGGCRGMRRHEFRGQLFECSVEECGTGERWKDIALASHVH
jgi:hypothetical protein